jgi:hypothetical protein
MTFVLHKNDMPLKEKYLLHLENIGTCYTEIMFSYSTSYVKIVAFYKTLSDGFSEPSI